MGTTTALVITMVAARLCGLAGLWLRLWWRAQQELAHAAYVKAAVGLVASGGQLELDDQHGAGHRFRMSVTNSPGKDRSASGESS